MKIKMPIPQSHLKTIPYLLLFLLSIVANSLSAQTSLDSIATDDKVIVELNKGSALSGTIISVKPEEIVLNSTTLGVLTIRKEDISKIEAFSEVEFLLASEENQPFSNKNWITETAIGLSEGEKQYQNVMLGGNVFAFGVSDRFTMGGGFELFSVFAQDFPIFWISPKLTISSSENIHFGVGSNLILAIDGPNTTFAGSVYGIATLGNANHNFTVGLGYAFYDFDTAERPAIQIGGMTRINNKLMLVADHLVISDNVESAIAGTWTLRYLNKKFSLDIGVAAEYETGAIPVLGISILY